MKKVVLVRIGSTYIVGEKKANFIWKPLLIRFTPNPQNPKEIRIDMASPFMGMVEPSGSKFVLPEGGYFITEAPSEMEKAWRQSVSGLKIPDINEINKIANIKHPDQFKK